MQTRIRWDVAVAAVVLIDVLAIYLPSLITILGRAGETPAEYIGGYAVAWFLLAFAAVPLCRIVSPRRVAAVAATAMFAARAALQFTDGGAPQLALATGAVLAGLAWLIALAMSAPDALGTATGLMAGLAGATAIHAALYDVDLAWRDGALAWVLALAEVIGGVCLQWLHWPGEPDTAAPARWWLALGPVVLLWGMYAGNPAYAGAASGWPEWVPRALTAGGAVAAVAVTARPRWRAAPWGCAAALFAAALGFSLAPGQIGHVAGVLPAWAPAIVPVAQYGIAASLGILAERSAPRGGARRGLAAAAGMLVLVVLVFAYYAAYDLGMANRWVPPLAAAAIGAIVLSGRRAGSASPAIRRGPVAILAGIAVIAAVLAAVAPLWNMSEAPTPAPGLRVAAYNTRMGFGQKGTYDVDDQARALAGLHPRIIALSEVDRGWMLNGGHDGLRRLAHRLGMRAYWAPAADELWGDAVLTNLPVTRVRNHALSPGGPTGAQALELDIRWRSRTVTFIATHTQPPPDWSDLAQARELAAVAARAEGRGNPVILAGDLNMEPTDRAFDTVRSTGLRDGFATERPIDTMAPGTPAAQIDHILATDDLSASDPAQPAVTYSDHRPVALTLDFR